MSVIRRVLSAGHSVSACVLLITVNAIVVSSSHVFVLNAGSRLCLRGGTDMVPPSTPLSGLVNGPLPEKYGKHFRKDATAMRAAPIGAITTSEAQQMRDLGILKGKWTIESEEEPSSDVQDADPNDWPEHWGGLEEEGDVVKRVPGPVRLYASSRYNRDVLPTGRLDPDTLRRLGPLLQDDTAFSQVVIDDDPRDLMPPADPESARAHDLPASSADDSDASPGGGGGRTMRASAGGAAAAAARAAADALPAGVSQNLADKWLKEALHPRYPDQPVDGGDVVPELDFNGHKCPERNAAEAMLDAAVADNDAGGIERALDALRRLESRGL